jgi:hypothetical protein
METKDHEINRFYSAVTRGRNHLRFSQTVLARFSSEDSLSDFSCGSLGQWPKFYVLGAFEMGQPATAELNQLRGWSWHAFPQCNIAHGMEDNRYKTGGLCRTTLALQRTKTA